MTVRNRFISMVEFNGRVQEEIRRRREPLFLRIGIINHT
jgi:hypothetical protein